MLLQSFHVKRPDVWFKLHEGEKPLTLKNCSDDPPSWMPYWIFVCLTRSSAESIGVNMFSIVRKAAKFAVYEEMMISVKNHQQLPTILPDIDLKKQPKLQSCQRAISISPV